MSIIGGHAPGHAFNCDSNRRGSLSIQRGYGQATRGTVECLSHRPQCQARRSTSPLYAGSTEASYREIDGPDTTPFSQRRYASGITLPEACESDCGGLGTAHEDDVQYCPGSGSEGSAETPARHSDAQIDAIADALQALSLN